MDFSADILAEALLNSFLPLFHELTLFAVIAFEAMEPQLALTAAIKGAMAALFIWIALGRIVSILLMRYKVAAVERTKAVFASKAGWFMPLALLFSFTPAGFAIAFAAGFFRTSLMTAFPAVLFAQAMWYFGVIGASV